MAPGLRGDEVRRQFRTALVKRLEPAGWSVLPLPDERHSVVAVMCPVAPAFAATAEVLGSWAVPDLPQHFLHGLMGVSFEPLAQLYPLLGRFRVAVLEEQLWPPESAGGDGVEVSGLADAERAASELARLILDRAVAFARRYSDVDALVDEVARRGGSAGSSGARGGRPVR